VTLVLRWRVPERRIAARWRGPAGMGEAALRHRISPIAAIIGPPGAGGAPLRIDASLAATWVVPHPLGRVPLVQVFLAYGDSGGEAVAADVQAGPMQITVTHASPCQGFVLLV
jgi:hypothetical protein